MNKQCRKKKEEAQQQQPTNRGNAARVVNGSGDEELVLAFDDERVRVIGDIFSQWECECEAQEQEYWVDHNEAIGQLHFAVE